MPSGSRAIARSRSIVRCGVVAAAREVKLGVRGTARSQVLSGLEAGDEVLLAPAGDAAGGETPAPDTDATAAVEPATDADA